MITAKVERGAAALVPLPEPFAEMSRTYPGYRAAGVVHRDEDGNQYLFFGDLATGWAGILVRAAGMDQPSIYWR